MDTTTFLAIIIPSSLAFIVSAAYIVLAIYREREKKKQRVWDLARDILLSYKSGNQTLEEEDAIQFSAYFHHLRNYIDGLSLRSDDVARLATELEELRITRPMR